MISIFVKADDKAGEALVANHYKFVAVPSVGDEVVITEANIEHVLRVTAITHIAHPEGDVMNPLSYIHIFCEPI